MEEKGLISYAPPEIPDTRFPGDSGPFSDNGGSAENAEGRHRKIAPETVHSLCERKVSQPDTRCGKFPGNHTRRCALCRSGQADLSPSSPDLAFSGAFRGAHAGFLHYPEGLLLRRRERPQACRPRFPPFAFPLSGDTFTPSLPAFSLSAIPASSSLCSAQPGIPGYALNLSPRAPRPAGKGMRK